MKTLQNNVDLFEKMTVIPNIQAMQGIVGRQVTPFNILVKKSIGALRLIQDALIPEYNESIKNKVS